MGVNLGSAAVGDYSIQKITELVKEGLTIPKDLKFSFSYIEKHIRDYVEKIKSFYVLRNKERAP